MIISDYEHPFALAYKLVEEGKLNPWDVDIVTLANAYLEEINKAELLDLRVPAKAILAASFLLKKKVQVMFPQPQRKVERKSYTLEEIVQLFEQEHSHEEELDNLKPLPEKHAKRRKLPKNESARRTPRRVIPVHVSRFEDAMVEVLQLLQRGMARFTLREIASKGSVVPYLMALMVLYYDGKISLNSKDDDLEVSTL